MIRKAKLILLPLLLLLCLSLTGCSLIKLPGQASVEEAGNAVNEQAVKQSMSDLKNSFVEDNKYPMSEETKELQQEVMELADELASQTVSDTWYGWMLSDGVCKESWYEGQKAKLNGALEKYNTAKLNDPIYNEAKNGEFKVKNELNTFNYKPFILIAAIVFLLILFAVIISITHKPKIKNKAATPSEKVIEQKEPEQEKLPEPVEQPRLEMAERSERLKADYPSLLKKDCEILGKDYDEVLSDFDGNAEKAYETIHVQALKVTYKE